MIWADTESCGLVGPTFTIQWAKDEGKVQLHYVWDVAARETLRVIDRAVEDGVGLWNATHDWLHLQRLHNILSLLPQGKPPTTAGWCRVEQRATDGPCVKPATCLDLFLHARKGPWQSLMARDEIRIRRVPSNLAQLLAEHLTKTIKIDGIYFTKREKGYRWEIDPESQKDDPEFPDVVLRFGASGGLKPLARHLLGAECVDFPMPDEYFPDEQEWNPFGHDWLRVFEKGRRWWREDAGARKYAADDVVLMRRLWHHFSCPKPGDTDSLLACQIASSRWRGYAVDRPATEKVLAKAMAEKESAPRDWRPVLAGLHERMSPVERLVVTDTRGETLEEIGGSEGKQGWVGGWSDNVPARDYARTVIRARTADKLVDYCGKLLAIPRGHPSFKITATLSDRMGGSGGFNWQALPDAVKKLLPLADRGLTLDGGDFWAFEVTLMAAIWKDAQLIKDLQSGHKIHALFGSSMTGMDYDDIYDDATEKPVDKDAYDRFKRGFFGKSMGAQEPKLAAVIFPQLSREEGIAKVTAGTAEFERRYPGVGIARQRIANAFCSMRQVGGIGTRVEWHEPKEYVDSLFGSRRYFTLENRICRELFRLANAMPSEFRRLRIKVKRRDRLQTPGGAAQSAIFAAAFNIQARAMRAAANHEIQASGARITKEVQGRVWHEQPVGVHPWRNQPLNEHDSLMVPTDRDLTGIVAEKVEEFRPTVPLIRMDWKHGLKSWGDK